MQKKSKVLSIKQKANAIKTTSQWGHTFIVRIGGYALLLLALIDVADQIIPAQFMNPRWEYETIGSLIERVPVTLIGFVLVFYGGLRYRNLFEKKILRPLGFVAILVGICLLLTMPLTVANAVRLNNQGNEQRTAEVSEQVQRLDQLENQITAASPEDVAAFAQRFNIQDVVGQPPNEIKSALIARVQNDRVTIREQAASVERQQQRRLLKLTVKWLMGAIIAGFGLIYIGFTGQRIATHQQRPLA
ncbi:hypothetical protein GS597_00400 [Synechococcales cyanobacterium C]|uniref:Uncharacterized protein n=1 Tax=Petrachloros mirabilis ULC683 TaxID=2781853 RepID=A0A8K2A666_9CYAN|nr:HpsJ family protein [Petrachloros mirabilis]NCJ05005.1 hypothetical protein [Petrachloros mirabilis ULC683]